jgi:predicted nucleic acid-binding protein
LAASSLPTGCTSGWDGSIAPRLLAGLGVGGNLTTDAHLAAIAIEHQCEIQSNDTDFGRFPGLRWSDPLLEVR